MALAENILDITVIDIAAIRRPKQRIAALHGGVLVAQSGQDGGACLVVSLPIVVPTSVPARNNPGYDNLGGYSPVLIELSDVLPWQAFAPSDTEE